MTIEAVPETNALDELADLLDEWATRHKVPEVYTRLLARFAANGYEMREHPAPWLAHFLHASLRSNTAADGAAPQDYLVLSAPDLGIGDRSGRQRHPLPSDPPERLAPLHRLLNTRRSIPYYSTAPMELATLAAILGTALGSRELLPAYNRRDVPSRMFPSAGGLQPVDAYVFANRVDGLEPGIYRYDPVDHALVQFERGDCRRRLVEATVHTDWLFYAPAVIALVGNFARVSWKYGTRGYRFLNVDTGVAAQNLYLATHALGLHGNAVAAFDDDRFNELLRLDGADQFTNLLFAAGGRAARVLR